LSSRKKTIAVVVTIVLLYVTYVTAVSARRAPLIPKDTTIELKMNNTCRSKVKHKLTTAITDETMYWEVTNNCTNQSAHHVEVAFDDPTTCATNSVLKADVPTGDTVTLSCKVEYDPFWFGFRHYSVIGDAGPDDPEVIIRGKDGLLWKILALILYFLRHPSALQG